MRFVSEGALAGVATGFPQIRQRFVGYRDDMLDHPVAGWCLRNYLILSECPELLGEHGLSEGEVYWNRYFWLVRFARIWSALAGYDAGLEQQVFQFLENLPHGGHSFPKSKRLQSRPRQTNCEPLACGEVTVKE
jgi:hypothetical protein